VGCGTGRCVKRALEAGHEAEGIDICQDLLDVAERDFGIPRDRLHCDDATRLPFPDNSFDVVCILGALHHSAMPHTIISEMIRVSRRAVVVSDGGNRLAGGVRHLLINFGLLSPLYRLLF
jgi:ubiquinone/menaquinone biosynthesis C-methylase UbiE